MLDSTVTTEVQETLDLMVDRRVLIPRPETEAVVDHALAEFAFAGLELGDRSFAERGKPDDANCDGKNGSKNLVAARRIVYFYAATRKCRSGPNPRSSVLPRVVSVQKFRPRCTFCEDHLCKDS